MVQTAVVITRFAAFVASVGLFGAPLFLLYSLPGRQAAQTPLKPWLFAAALLVALSAAGALVAQTGEMAGDPKAGLDLSTLSDVLTGGGFGTSVLVRGGAGLLASLLIIVFRAHRALWAAVSVLGGAALAALAWSGHGAADEGAAGLVHTLADVVHLLAVGVWLGALAALVLLLVEPRRHLAGIAGLHGAIERFSGVGSLVAATILVTGLLNSWFLVGPAHVSELARSTWGRLLLVKLALFTAMLGFAALNRFRLTPSLKATTAVDPAGALTALRRSIALETAAGLAVLILVALLGLQAPPALA